MILYTYETLRPWDLPKLYVVVKSYELGLFILLGGFSYYVYKVKEVIAK